MIWKSHHLTASSIFLLFHVEVLPGMPASISRNAAIIFGMLVLRGRKIVAFPDIDGYDEWQRKLQDYPELGVTVSPILQQNATMADREAHIDIADWLLRYMYGPAPTEEDLCHAEFLKAAEFVSADKHEELESLIRDLGLEFIRAEKIPDDDLPP